MRKPYPARSAHPGRWLLLLAAAGAALAGYFGPWIPHPAAGLVVTGLDLAEYVKFIPEVMSGQIALQREAFYTPLMAGSLMASLFAGRRALPRPLRGVLLLAAAVLALAMLPPAWSPAVLRLPEFRIQTVAILVCLAAIPLAALTRFLPDRLILGVAGVLAVLAGTWPAFGFLRVKPAIETIYNAGLALGWGFWAAAGGWLAAAILALTWAITPPKSR